MSFLVLPQIPRLSHGRISSWGFYFVAVSSSFPRADYFPELPMSISLYGKTVFGFSGEVKGFVGFAIFAARFSEFAEYPGAEAMHQARELRITNLIATFRRLDNAT
jgi:hypothetical protein